MSDSSVSPWKEVNRIQLAFPPRLEPQVVSPLNYAVGTSDDPKQHLRSSKAAKNSSSNKKKGTKKRKDNQKAPPTTSSQRNMHKQRQEHNMSPDEAQEHHKSSPYHLRDNKTKGFTKNHNVRSPKTSDPKKDAPETSTPDNTFEKRRALSNSPPSRKRRHESESDIEVKEETPKKKRISVTHPVGSLSSDD